MIQQFIITVLVIYGVKASTDDGMILHGLYMTILKLLDKFFSERVVIMVMKPLFDCTPCMASVYGTASFFLYGDFPEPMLLSLTVWVFALCGFNYILNKIIS